MWILKFKLHDCWIASWDGDPGRTLDKLSAKFYKSKEEAEKAATEIIKANANRRFELVAEEIK